MSPKLIVILGSVAVAVLLLVLVVGPAIKRSLAQHEVRRSGVDAVATIRAIHRTNMGVDEQAEIRIVFWVEPRALEPYEAELTTTVQIADLSSIYVVGERMHVRYDPNDPKRLALIGPASP